MNILTIALATLPGLLIVIYIYYKDIHDKEPHKYLIWCFLFGALSTVPAIWLERWGMSLGYDVSPDIVTTFIFAFIVVAGSEELVKYVFLRGYIFPKEEFNEPLDGIVYAVMIGMGFATTENIMYATSYGLHTTIIRAFTAVPAHAAFAVIMGYYVGIAKFTDGNRIRYLLQGFLGAVALHGAYDFFIFQKNYPALTGLTMVTLIIGIVLSRRMIRIHQEMSPFNTDEIAESRAAIEVSNELDFIPDENKNPYAQDENGEDDDNYSLL
jgi:RsiW-degrading membrane proteinase PrsW (M82 family)